MLQMELGDKFKLGIELYEALFALPELTQLRLLLFLEPTGDTVLTISTNGCGAGKVLKNFPVSTAYPVDIGFSIHELNVMATT